MYATVTRCGKSTAGLIREVAQYRITSDDPVNVHDEKLGKQSDHAINLPEESELVKIYYTSDSAGFNAVEKPEDAKWNIMKLISPLCEFKSNGFYDHLGLNHCAGNLREGIILIPVSDYVEPDRFEAEIEFMQRGAK